MAAYLATRLAPDYAACVRVLRELHSHMHYQQQQQGRSRQQHGKGQGQQEARRRPVAVDAVEAWQPREVLIHGAGVGAPLWALMEVRGSAGGGG